MTTVRRDTNNSSRKSRQLGYAVYDGTTEEFLTKLDNHIGNCKWVNILDLVIPEAGDAAYCRTVKKIHMFATEQVALEFVRAFQLLLIKEEQDKYSVKFYILHVEKIGRKKYTIINDYINDYHRPVDADIISVPCG